MKSRRLCLVLSLLLLASGLYWGTRSLAPSASGAIGPIEAEDTTAISARTQRQELEGNPDDPSRCAVKVGGSRIVIDDDNGCVLRKDAAGKTEWSVRLGENLRGWWWPNLLTDSRRVFVKEQFKSVTALDLDTGQVLWRKQVSVECFWLSRDLLLVVVGCQVVGLAADSGAKVFQLALQAPEHFRPVSIVETDGLFLVQGHADPGDNGDAFLIDRAGRVCHHFNRQIFDLLTVDRDRIVVTSKDVLRISPEDEVRWTVAFPWQGLAEGRILRLQSGDLIVALYHPISDSGVELMRLHPITGNQNWDTYCQPLGVTHSDYSHHVNVEVAGDRLRVIGRGEAAFVEILDIATGVQLNRNDTLPRPSWWDRLWALFN